MSAPSPFGPPYHPYQLRASKAKAGDRTFEVVKFRSRVPALEDPAASVSVRRRSGRLSVDAQAPLEIEAGGSTYEGTRERVGASSSTNSSYVVFRVDAQQRLMSVTPLADWYSLRPAIAHSTYSIEEAEAHLLKKDRAAMLADRKLSAMRRDDDDDDEGTKGKGKGGKAKKSSSAGAAAEGFDDGAGAEWQANEANDEDGNEGMDMEDEDLFDDDDDDGLDDDDEVALAERKMAREAAAEKGSARRARDGDDEFEELDEEEGEEEGGAKRVTEGAAAYAKSLKEAKKRERKANASGSSEEDEDDEEAGAEELRKIIAAGAEPDQPEAEKPEKVGAGGKRALSPGEPAGAAKKARAEAATSAAAALAAGSGKVAEKDVVMVLHKHGKMQLKQLNKIFKGFTASKEDKQAYLTMVSKIAKLSDNLVTLRDETLERYGLPDPEA